MPKCRYCAEPAIHNVVWFRGKDGLPGRVVVPHCGQCDLYTALKRFWPNPDPIAEGRDYVFEPLKEALPLEHTVLFNVQTTLPDGRVAYLHGCQVSVTVPAKSASEACERLGWALSTLIREQINKEDFAALLERQRKEDEGQDTR